MPLLDLVTPWVTALADPDATARRDFHDHHHALLERIRRQRAPLAEQLPLASAGVVLERAAAHAANSTLHEALRDAATGAAALGADAPSSIVLMAGDGTGDESLALPGDPPLVVLSLELLPDLPALLAAMARVQAALTRWTARESGSRLRSTGPGAWDGWELSRSVALGEWIYAAGIGVHLAEAILPEEPPHCWLGLRRGEVARLRERERSLRDLLARDLGERGLGLLLRWLAPDTPASARRVGDTVIPPGAGRYLGWRMTAERVARLGLSAAIRAEA